MRTLKANHPPEKKSTSIHKIKRLEKKIIPSLLYPSKPKPSKVQTQKEFVTCGYSGSKNAADRILQSVRDAILYRIAEFEGHQRDLPNLRARRHQISQSSKRSSLTR